MKKMLIVDGHALLHRAFHALPPLTNKKGEPVGAVFGFFSILLSVLREVRPDFLAVCFDSAAPTFRHREFIGYQAKRAVMSSELKGQISRTQKALKRAGIMVLAKPGFEGDDLIATLAKKAKRKIQKILVLTGDKDLMQLVDRKVNLLLLQRQMNQFLQVAPRQVKQQLGVKPARVVDLKALTGDASDNYPGVPGVGPKTALELLKKYGSFANIYQHLDKIPKGWRKKLEEGREAGELSLKLAQVTDQVPLKINLGASRWQKENLWRLKEVLAQEGFVSLVRRMDKFFALSTKKTQQQNLFVLS